MVIHLDLVPFNDSAVLLCCFGLKGLSRLSLKIGDKLVPGMYIYIYIYVCVIMCVYIYNANMATDSGYLK